jgi:two-component system, NtrC family, sensor kinase
MQGINPVTSADNSAFTGASNRELQKITNFLLQLHHEVQNTSNSESLINTISQLILEDCDPVFFLIAVPEFEKPGEFNLHSRIREGFPDVSAFIRNLLSSGIDSVSPDFVDSIPEMKGLPRILVKSSADAALRLLIFVVVDDQTAVSWLRAVSGPLEQMLRISVDNFYRTKGDEVRKSYLEALHQTAKDFSRTSYLPEDLMRKTTQQAVKTFGANGCAVLFPKDDDWSIFEVQAPWGFESGNIPLPRALFRKAYEDFEAESGKSVVYNGSENEKFLMVPLIHDREPLGILFLYANRPDFHLNAETLQIAEIFAYRLSLGIENATTFRQALESQTEWENTFDSISDPIYIVDKEFRLKKINRSLAQVVNREDAPGNRNCYRYLFQRDVICPWCPVLKVMESEEPVTVEAKLFGAGLWQIQSFPYRDKSGARVGAIQVLRDITLLKKMQDQLIETEKLASMGKLISGVAHEVRNPLFGISATARALSNELGDEEKFKPYLEIITSETARLNRLMEDLLDYSRPVRIDKNPSDLAEIIQEVIDHFRQVSSTNHVVINFLCADRIPAITVDSNKIKQVLFNLVENGIQHAGDHPQIDLFLEFLSLMDPPQIRIVIKDNGAGVPPDNLPRIFDPFFTTRQRGTGLGLSIVRKVVHDHDGHIAVESHLGVGTTFRISLPVFVQTV